MLYQKFLNEAGFYWGANIVAWCPSPEEGEAQIRISDCFKTVKLDFCVVRQVDYENSMKKLDVLEEAIRQFRAALVRRHIEEEGDEE